jgi:hypothetical protein
MAACSKSRRFAVWTNFAVTGLLKKIARRGGDTPGNLRRSTGCHQHGGDVLRDSSGEDTCITNKREGRCQFNNIPDYKNFSINIRLELSNLYDLSCVAKLQDVVYLQSLKSCFLFLIWLYTDGRILATEL